VSGTKNEGHSRAADAEAFIEVNIGSRRNRRRREAILDSGCTHSILPLKWVPKGTKIRPVSVKTTTADNRQVAMAGQADIQMLVGHQMFNLNVWVSDKVPQFLLGYDWLSEPSVVYRVGSGTMQVRNEQVKVHVRTVGDNTRRVCCADTVEIPPDSWRVVRVSSSRADDVRNPHPTDWMVEPGILPPYVVSARVALSVLDGSQGVVVTNVGDEPVVILQGMPLGVAEKIAIVSEPLSGEPTTRQPAAAPPAEGRVRMARSVADDESTDKDSDTDSDNYDSDTPNEWESEIDRQSARPIDELLANRPASLASPCVVNAARSLSR
jgi:hypothetical protein